MKTAILIVAMLGLTAAGKRQSGKVNKIVYFGKLTLKFMSTGNATFKLRKRTVEIKWLAQYGGHVLDNYMNKKKTMI